MERSKMGGRVTLNGKALVKARRALGWSQYVLAKKAQMSEKRVRELENKGSPVGGRAYFHTAVKLASALGLKDVEILLMPEDYDSLELTGDSPEVIRRAIEEAIRSRKVILLTDKEADRESSPGVLLEALRKAPFLIMILPVSFALAAAAPVLAPAVLLLLAVSPFILVMRRLRRKAVANGSDSNASDTLRLRQNHVMEVVHAFCRRADRMPVGSTIALQDTGTTREIVIEAIVSQEADSQRYGALIEYLEKMHLGDGLWTYRPANFELDAVLIVARDRGILRLAWNSS